VAFAKLEVHENVNIKSSLAIAAKVFVGLNMAGALPFWFGPWPSLPPPFNQQSGFVWPLFLQFSHLLLDTDDADSLYRSEQST
jgi:hypothetical protein